MNINRIFIKNIGPFEKLDLNLAGESIALVGANGTGKTFLISSVVDFIYEHLNSIGFDDTLPSIGNGYRYFRKTTTRYVRSPMEGGFIWLEGEIDGKELYYLEQYNYEDATQIAEMIGVEVGKIPWPEPGYLKKINNLSQEEKQSAKKIAWSEPIFFLPATKFENESWKTEEFFRDNLEIANPTTSKLGHPIEIFSSIRENTVWLVNEFMDSKVYPQHPQFQSHIGLVNKVLTLLAGEQAQIGLGMNRSDRLVIMDGEGKILVKSLSYLSLGQMSILNMVLNILRLGSQNVAPQNMKGLVVIDEIDTHLTGDYKTKIIPSILKMFPKIQFIITTHDPESVVGLENGSNIRLIELPGGEEILAKDYSELKKLRQNIKTANKQLHKIIEEIKTTNKPALVVEDSYTKIYKIGWLKSRGKTFTEQNLDSTFETEAPFSIVSANGRYNLYSFLNMDNLPDDVANSKIAGLFDFDEAFNDFNGLSANGSWEEINGVAEDGLYKANSDGRRIAMMLPVPRFRNSLASIEFGSNSCLEIELYFEDGVLGTEHCGIDPNRPGEITKFLGDKATFWKKCIDYPEENFVEFGKLFDKIETFLGVSSGPE